VREKLASDGFNPTYGARPLKREIEQQIENPLAMKIVAGELAADQPVRVRLDGDAVMFEVAAKNTKTPATTAT
jgi:ATP-dependent Clp protease ATP-binding subunit ClpC